MERKEEQEQDLERGGRRKRSKEEVEGGGGRPGALQAGSFYSHQQKKGKSVPQNKKGNIPELADKYS